MELSLDEEFVLRGFSPHQLAFLPSLNCILASDGRGTFKCVDIVSGKEYPTQELVLPSSFPLFCQVNQTTSKLVVACGNRLCARLANDGSVQLKTMLQTPVKSSSDEVAVEIPLTAAHRLVKELHRHTVSHVTQKKKAAITKQLEEGLRKSGSSEKFGTVTFSGQLSSLLSIFEGLVKRASDDSSSSTASKSAGNSCAPLYSSILLRLQLLDPTEGRKLMGFERGDTPSSNEARLMNVEAIRRLSLSGWPHWGYEWAIPKTMAEAGFYQTTNTNHGISSVRGDRVSCFQCRVYLYSWEPTDEPWSEHQRHAYQCQFVRGEYTTDVPMAMTASSHPAQECANSSDSVVCMSTGTGSGLVALGTEQGRITVWDVDRGLFIMEQAQLDLTEDRILQYLTQKTITIAIDQPPNTEAGPTQPASSREEDQHNEQGEDSFEDVPKQQLSPGDPEKSDKATL